MRNEKEREGFYTGAVKACKAARAAGNVLYFKPMIIAQSVHLALQSWNFPVPEEPTQTEEKS